MSWSLFMVPLHSLARDGLAEWLASATSTRGLPDEIPLPRPLPTVAEVLDAFRLAGCHGTNWFEVIDEDAGTRLPECPEPTTCASVGGLDLGEVSLYATGQTSSLPPIPADVPVETVTFRKPSAAAVMRAACALASSAGPQLLFDHSGDPVFVVWPGEVTRELELDWPW
ncbi:hypothetical protein [Cryptosporangium minutisporangium]|uniref:Uncharacterized protein n=1 Tax=Cryptosporangium minutisporangium TaxID=113569 RepID=A0ABP6SYB5_9ACTN